MPPAEPCFVAEIVPPRGLEASMVAARGLFAALSGGGFGLDVAVTPEGPRWLVRGATEAALAGALAQVRLAYPQAGVEYPVVDSAPATTERAVVRLGLRPLTDPDLPLRSDWRDERDPLAGLLTAAAVEGDERVVLSVTVEPGQAGAGERIRGRAPRDPRRGYAPQSAPSPSIVPLLSALAIAAGGLQAWRWYEAGEWALLGGAGAGAFVGLPLLVTATLRWLGRREPIPLAVVERKLATPLRSAGIEVSASSPNPARARMLATQVAASYGAYDDQAGGGLRPALRRRWRPGREPRLPLSAAELAALWHLPDEAGAPVRVRRTTAVRLAPTPGHAAEGVRVGVADAASDHPAVRMPVALLHRNQLIVAKTRRGKSTLLRHLAGGLMARSAEGLEDTALVVVDPHQDLAEAVLASVPEALAERTVYLDFANRSRPIGLNLLDVHLFPDRDRTTEHVITMLNRLWPDNWGPRMEGALRATLLVLLELNRQRPRHAQYTLLDVAPFLTDYEWRRGLLDEVDDPALLAWWRDNYERAGQVLRQQTANPVTSKIGRFTVTEASRLVLGQSASTFDPRAVLRDGGVLVVNTAVGLLGEGAASLVGATLLNLLGLIVEEQVAVPPEQRRRVVQLVDESSTLGAVDYPRMLSELGKYGANFVLVTQSLTKLDAVDPNLAPTIFANSDALTVFQVSAEDAHRLTPELGAGIEVEDLVSLDDFTCYARWWDGRTRPAAFSFAVDPPPPAAIERMRTIAARSARRHGRPHRLVVREVSRALSERVPPRVAVPGTGQKGGAGGAPEVTSGTVAPSAHADAAIDTPPSGQETSG